MLAIVRIVFLLAFLVCGVWVIYHPGYDSAAAAFAAFAAFLASVVKKKSTNSGVEQSQRISLGSTGVQAGRDVHIDKVGK